MLFPSFARLPLPRSGGGRSTSTGAGRKGLLLAYCTVLLAAGVTGCEDAGAGDPPENCSSDQGANYAESPLMEPGGDCIACHASKGEGPSYAIAGTVMGALDDDQRCVGVEEITVVISDANGKNIELVTNAVGNFFTSESFKAPYTAKVIRAGSEKIMATPQTNGACASCHSATGNSGAPGRITAP